MVFQCQLEEVLRSFEEKLLSLYKQGSLTKAFERISDRYRRESGSFLQTEEERWAYLFTRMPATFAVAFKVFSELQARAPDLSPQSFLDVGAGPGTGMWAVSEIVQWEQSLNKCTLLEKDNHFLSMGKLLASHSTSPWMQAADWKVSDMTGALSVGLHDVTLLSYSIGEVEESHWQRILETLWTVTGKALVIVEPGTPKGYKRMMKLRDMLLSLGGFIWSPCPHHKPCPLPDLDWCHFSARVQRSSLHRKLKSAELGHEDEKFCYLIVGKNPCAPFQGRIIRHPVKHSGFIEMTLCQKESVEKIVFSKREKEKYKSIKKLTWGDVID